MTEEHVEVGNWYEFKYSADGTLYFYVESKKDETFQIREFATKFDDLCSAKGFVKAQEGELNSHGFYKHSYTWDTTEQQFIDWLSEGHMNSISAPWDIEVISDLPDKKVLNARIWDICVKHMPEEYEGETKDLLGKWKEITGDDRPGYLG